MLSLCEVIGRASAARAGTGQSEEDEAGCASMGVIPLGWSGVEREEEAGGSSRR